MEADVGDWQSGRPQHLEVVAGSAGSVRADHVRRRSDNGRSTLDTWVTSRDPTPPKRRRAKATAENEPRGAEDRDLRPWGPHPDCPDTSHRRALRANHPTTHFCDKWPRRSRPIGHFSGTSARARPRKGWRSVGGVVTLSSAQLLAVRARSHLLAGPRPQNAVDAIRRLGALQAQSTPAVRMAVRVRTEGVTATEFDQALAIDRTVVRTWLMRGTLHLVAAEDLGWMVDLLGPIVRVRSHRRRTQLGLTDELCERALAALPYGARGQRPDAAASGRGEAGRSRCAN